jgi:hypothetical protein
MNLPNGNVVTPASPVAQNIHEGGGPVRFGTVAYHMDLGNYVVPDTNKDRIYHVAGFLPHLTNGTGRDRTLAAYGFSLGTDEENPEGGNIRGIFGDVYATAGKANIRAIRVISYSKGTHTGDMTGVLATVDHPEQPSGVAGAIGKAIAIIGSVGAKCLAAFEARAFRGSQRPAFGYSIERGSEGLLPDKACYSAHGGGNGDMFQGFRDNLDSATTYSVDNRARVMARSFTSGRRSIPDDGVIVIANPSPGHTGFIKFWIDGATVAWGEGYYRTNGSPHMQQVRVGSNKVAFTTGVLTGTAGVLGNLTVSSNGDGNLYVENRMGGGPVSFNWRFTAPSNEAGQID